MSTHINDEGIATQELRRRSSNFRRVSVNAGVEFDSVEKADGGIDGGELVNSFIDMVKGATQVDGSTKEWLAVNGVREQLQKADESAFESFFTHLADKLKLPLKMARRGMVGNLLISLVCTYGDLISDALMVNYYWENNMMGKFYTCLTILAGSLGAQGLISWILNNHLPPTKRLVRVMQGVCCMNPALYAYSHWSGHEREEGSNVTPMQLLTYTKLVELLFESLPQMAVQLSAIFDLIVEGGGGVDILPVVSIIFSVAAVGFAVTDLGMMFERNTMALSIRGPYTHPFLGVLPERFGAVFFLGNMMFVSGFFAMTLITATTAVKSGWGNAVAAYEVAELLLFHALMNVTGRGRYILGGKSGIGLLDVLRPEWLLASVAPFLLWRGDEFLGGAIWSRLILYRVVVMTVVTYAGSDALDAEIVFVFLLCALACVLVGFTTMVVFASNSHRWTLYSTRTTPKEYRGSLFGSDDAPLTLTFTTHDEMRLALFTYAHPYYYAEKKDDVKKWMLGMRVTDELFQGGVAPKGAHQVRGQPFETVFSKIKKRYEYFNDKEGDAAISSHLDALLIEINNLRLLMDTARTNRLAANTNRLTANITAPKKVEGGTSTLTKTTNKMDEGKLTEEVEKLRRRNELLEAKVKELTERLL